jgi:hypothetical protein
MPSYQENVCECMEDLEVQQTAGADLDAFVATELAAVTPKTPVGKALLAAVRKAWDAERIGATIEQRAKRIVQARVLITR